MEDRDRKIILNAGWKERENRGKLAEKIRGRMRWRRDDGSFLLV